MENFGKLLRETRLKLKLSGPTVAKKLGVSRNYVYALEKGSNPSLELVVKLSEIYGDPTIVNAFMDVRGLTEIQHDDITGVDSIKYIRNHIVHGKIDELIAKEPEVVYEILNFVNKLEKEVEQKKKPNDDIAE